MTSIQFSLATVMKVIVLIAANCMAIRWGLGLPNLMANSMIQEIVTGGTPMASALVFGLVLAFHDRLRRGVCRPSYPWPSGAACGALPPRSG